MYIYSSKVIGLLVLLGCHVVVAQAQFNSAKHEFGVTAGMFIYHGDLTPEAAGAFKSPGFAANLFYNRILSPSFSLRTNLAIGRLRADEMNYDKPPFRQERAFRFKARITEISELLVWNILRNNYSDRKVISPYLMAGVGISVLNIRRDWSNFNPDYFASEPQLLEGLAADTAHALPRSTGVVPVGMGLRYSISPKLSLMAEASYRITFTDYLDGFSKAANPQKNDNYSNYAVGIVYTLGSGRGGDATRCPVIRD